MSGQFDLLASLIVVLILAVIGVYAWTYKVANDTNKKIAEVYSVVNNHLQNANIHGEMRHYVSQEVCNAHHENLSRDISEIKADLKSLIKKG